MTPNAPANDDFPMMIRPEPRAHAKSIFRWPQPEDARKRPPSAGYRALFDRPTDPHD